MILRIKTAAVNWKKSLQNEEFMDPSRLSG